MDANIHPRFLKEEEASRLCNLSLAWLRRARRFRTGPRYLRVGRMVRYRTEDLDAYMAARVVETEDQNLKVALCQGAVRKG